MKAAFDVWKQRHVRPASGRTLIVGSRVYKSRTDRRSAFADAVGVDMTDGPGVDVVHNLELPAPHIGIFNHVECVSVLEHSVRPWLLAANLQDVMHRGATILLSVPFVWRVHAYPSDYWRFTTEAVRVLFDRVQWASLVYGTSCEVDADCTHGGHLHGTDGEKWFRRTQVFGFGVKA